MSNLLENALKYTEDKVLIEAYKSEHYFTISVNDYGSGFSEQSFQSLSKPFVRGRHTTTSHNRVGSGLGLSIVHYLCQTQGWKVVAKSHLDSSVGLSMQIQIPYR
jgi:signal transduction histidine kinase